MFYWETSEVTEETEMSLIREFTRIMQAARRQHKNAKSKPLIQSEEIRGKEGSLDNMLIHGDNKAAMKNLLEQGYGGKIQMIYIAVTSIKIIILYRLSPILFVIII